VLADHPGKSALADNAECEPIFIICLFHRAADKSRGVLDSGAAVEPGKPLPQVRPIAVDKGCKFFRIVPGYLPQEDAVIDPQFQAIHPGSIRGYTETMEVRELSERMRQREDQLFLLLTLIIGAIVGLTIVAFIIATERVGLRLYPADGAPWRRLVTPIIGALVTGYFLFRYFPEARGSGIPQTKTALFAGSGDISLRTVIGKFLCSSASLASGIALGREGPSVHIGAGIASVLARWLRLPAEKVKSLLPVGAAAALAAAFNTPIAAVLFSLEEVMGDLHAPLLGSVVLSSATSWIVLHLLLGDEPLFHVPAYHLVHPVEFTFYAVLGVVGGLVSVWFVKMLLWMRSRFLTLPVHTLWLQPAAGGLVVGIFGWFVPEVLGVGYTYVGDALNGRMALKFMALLVILKVIATTSSYASGNAGGIFGPSLFIGAMVGGTVGSLAHLVLPQYTADVGAYALVGMGTTFAGIVRVPLTSVIMIFEMTRDYTIIVPLMISNLVSFYISYKLQRTPIYEALAHQVGIHLPSATTRQRLAQFRVGAAMRHPAVRLESSMSPAAALEAFHGSNGDLWPLFDGDKFTGMVSRSDLDRAVKEGCASIRLISHEHQFTHVHSDHTLDVVLHRMGSTGMRVLPVVSRRDIRRLEGIVTLDDVLRVYGLEDESE
jgi:chloride channel protein, CIC family